MPVPSWSLVDDLTRDLAAVDVHATGSVRPTILGFDGETFLGSVELRAHPAGGYEAPIIEALALLVPLGSDRLVHVASGRVWSLDDPIPPVSGDVDLRQTAAVVLRVDLHERAEPVVGSTILPFDRADDGEVRWLEPVELPGDGEGPLLHLLTVLLMADVGRVDDQLTIGRQALRLLRLGHDLQIPGEGGDVRLAACMAAALDSELSGEPQPDWVLSPDRHAPAVDR